MAFMGKLFVGLGLCALFCSSFASEKCTSVLYGQQTLNPRPLTLAYFAPGTKLQQITIHAGCDAVGVFVTACDDVAPNVYVKSTTEAVVERLGSLNYLGYASVVAYCPTLQGQGNIIVSPKPLFLESLIRSDED